MSVSTKQFHETNFLVCHIINILLTLVGYLRESWYRPQEKKNYPRPSTLDKNLHSIAPTISAIVFVRRRSCHNNSVILFWTTSADADDIIRDRLTFSFIKAWSRTIIWITKINLPVSRIISKLCIKGTSRRLSSPEGWSLEREAFWTGHEVARTEQRGINPNHYCKQLSSYGFISTNV